MHFFSLRLRCFITTMFMFLLIEILLNKKSFRRVKLDKELFVNIFAKVHFFSCILHY